MPSSVGEVAGILEQPREDRHSFNRTIAEWEKAKERAMTIAKNHAELVDYFRANPAQFQLFMRFYKNISEQLW